MAIYEKVLAWADRLPPWRHDALRRLCVQRAWSDTDLDEILDLAKQHNGITSVLESVPVPIRFTAEHFRPRRIRTSLSLLSPFIR